MPSRAEYARAVPPAARAVEWRLGQDTRGEVYVLGSLVLGPTGTSGKVFKIVRADE